MRGSSSSGLSRRSVVKGLGTGVAAGLAGCTGGGKGAAEEFGGNGNEGGTSSGGNKGNGNQILFWTYAFPNDDNPPVWKSAFKQNYKKRTDSGLQVGRFSYEDMRSKFLTGAKTGEPDAIEGVLSHLTEYVKAGHLEPIGEEAKRLDFFDGFVDSAVKAMRHKGKLYGLPYNGNGRALIARKDILEELGQDVPKTASAFHEIGRMINEEYDDVWAYHNCTKDGSVRAFQEWMSHVYQHTDQLYVPDGDSWKLNISAGALGQIFDNWYYQVWAADKPLANPDQLGTGWQVNDPGYLNGKFAFIECGPWLQGWTTGENINNSGKTETILGEKTRVAHLPRAKGGSKGTYLEVKPVMVNSHTKQKDKAFQAVAAFSSPKTLKKMAEDEPGNAMTPVHEDVESTIEDEDWKPFTEVFKSGRALAKIGWGPVRQKFYGHMQEVAYGKTDPYKAGNAFHEELKNLTSKV